MSCENYLSGLGLGAYILFNRIPAGADPLGPDNILGFLTGLLTGTGTFFSGRWMVAGKSPLTGCWGDANCGGNLSPAIKRCGYDGIFFKGISEKPVYLYVDSGRAELRDASSLWGRDAVETEETLLMEGGKGARVACIGQAGENRSLIAGICNDKGRLAPGRAWAPLMGSKRRGLGCEREATNPAFNRHEIKRLSQSCNAGSSSAAPLSGPALSRVGTLMRLLPTQMAQDGLLYKFFLKKWGNREHEPGVHRDRGLADQELEGDERGLRARALPHRQFRTPLPAGSSSSTTATGVLWGAGENAPCRDRKAGRPTSRSTETVWPWAGSA